jgi:hypothetical protein
MGLNFSSFSSEPFPCERSITDRSGAESSYVDDFFDGRKRFDITVTELREDYEGDGSACLTFMKSDAFFLPLFRKMATANYDEAGSIPGSVAYKLHRMATGAANSWLEELERTYSRNQRDVILSFLRETSRIEWQHQVLDLAADAEIRLRERFDLRRP